MIRIILLFALVLSAGTYGSEWYQSPRLLALMKENDALTASEALHDPDIPDRSESRIIHFGSIEARLGILAPGPSKKTERFGSGITAGARMPIPFSWGDLAVSLDLIYLPTPPGMDEERITILMGGADYLWNFGRFYACAGLALANNSYINDLLLIHGEAGLHLPAAFSLSLAIYIPPGHENNRIMTALRCGYVF